MCYHFWYAEVATTMTDAEPQGGEHNPGRLAYLAELQCFMCGSLAGSIETDRKPTLFEHRTASPPASPPGAD